MKKLFTYLLVATTLFIAACSESYDDSALVGRVDNLENRIEKLEQLCQQMNTNISSLQTIVNALSQNDYITNVAPISKNGEEVGYTITLKSGKTITIYHGKNGADGKDGQDGADGKDGKDGYTPQIGVKQDADGIYYWTLDGDWLLDNDGNKIKAQGIDGKDGQDGTNGSDGEDGEDGENGITPQLKIEDNYWYVSYDNGASCTQLGKATGEDGKDGTNGIDGVDGDSFFQDVNTTNSDYVIFTLANGIELAIPRFKGLSIIFDVEDGVACLPSRYITVGYTLTGADEGTTVEAFGDGGWKADVIQESTSNGNIKVTSPANGGTGKVIMLATTSTGFTAMKTIHIDEGVFNGMTETFYDDRYRVGMDGGTFEIPVTTNLDYTVKISTNPHVPSWIYVADTRATMRNETLTVTVQAWDDECTNKCPQENHRRSTSINLISKDGYTLHSFIITQGHTWKVRTVAGEVNETNKEVHLDGPFDDCGNFANAEHMCVDPLNPNHVWISGDNTSPGTNIRLLDFEKNSVTTLFKDPAFIPNPKRVRWVDFTTDGKYNMLVALDSWTADVERPGVLLIERDPSKQGIEAFAESAKNPFVLVKSFFVNGLAVHPWSNSLFFNCYSTTGVYKFPDHSRFPELKGNPEGIYHFMNNGQSAYQAQHTQMQYTFGDRHWEFVMHMHPTGKYMIGVHVNGTGFLSKTYYDEGTDTFGTPDAFVNSHVTMGLGGSSGYMDGVGLNAKIATPREGCFVYNPAYEGQEDEYDFYFTDSANHCVRKVTPQGVVSTFAGRGTCNDAWYVTGTNSSAKGYADGLARGEALFNWPRGIAYLKSRNSFIVGDCGNKRIREIYFE